MSNNIFSIDDRNKYTFRIDSITSCFYFRSKKNIAAAEELFRKNCVSVKSAKLLKEKYNILLFEAEITDFDKSVHTVKIKVNEYKMLYIDCNPSHDGHGHYDKTNFHRSPCKFEIAAMMALNEYIQKYNPGDTTDYSALLLIDSFKKIHSAEKKVVEKTNDIIFEISLKTVENYSYYSDRECESIYASFKIGNSRKMYVAKDFHNIIEKYRKGETLKMGKMLELDFSKSDFTPESKMIFKLLEQWFDEEERIAERISNRYSYNNVSNITKDSIRLDSFMLDTLYDCLYDMIKIEGYPIHKTEKNIKLSMKISPSFRGKFKEFDGIDILIEFPKIYKGEKYFYTIEKKQEWYIFNRIPIKQSHLLRNLKTDKLFCSPKKQSKMHIGAKRVSEFIHNTLPNMTKYMFVSDIEIDNILQYLPPSAEIHFYLDAADGIPACYPRAVYNGTEFDFTDHLKSIGTIDSIRDTDREQSALEMAMKYFNIPDTENKRIICEMSDSDRIYELLTNGLDELMQIGQVHSTDSFDSIHIKKNYNFSMGISLENDLLNLEITSTDFTSKELLDIIKSYRKKKKYHLLKNGSFIPIDERINELSLMLEAMNINAKDFTKGKMRIPAYRALYLDKMLEECHELYANRDSHYKKLIRNFKTVNDSDFEVPEELQGIMREYQKYGYRWLKTLETYQFGGILADDMGLGKTLQIISVLLSAKKESSRKNPPSLIVCPSSLIYNWYEEFKKFAPDMKILTISGIASERKKLITQVTDYDAVVTSYDLLKRDIAEYDDKKFLYQIIDEAQYIKNHSTAASKSVKLIHSKYRFALTGTPIENRLSELWSIFDYLMPNFLYGYETFRKDIETPIVKRNDEEASRRLRRIVSPFILRRLKTDVLKDLPDKLEKTQYSKFEPEQRKIYDGQVLRIQQMLNNENDDEFQKNKLQLLAELTKIRQICCDPSLIYENYYEVSAKRVSCLELVKNAIDGKHRVLIFSQFTSMLEIISDDLRNENISFYTIVGSTPKEKRIELVNEFNDGDVPVFLISLKAGGTGLNLTGADVVIHFDPWWNYATQNQATDRAHRIGQTKTVTVYKLIIKNTIEEKIQLMQEQKKSLAESILTSDSINISSLSRKELLELFEL
ncbi:MAG: SNF2 helicase associated domain-containing protein [Ruminococcus sp.]|nr:SNF2 helicase associated domain-containing protein [Ruminococcus sp.]